MTADVIAGKEVSRLLWVTFPIRDRLHDLRGEALWNPRFVVYDKWMTYTLADIGWLAGIIDGEGTVSLSHGSNRSPHLRVSIYNGDPAILDKLHAVLDGLAIRYHEFWDRRAVKPNLHVTIVGANAIRLHHLVGHYMVRHSDRLSAAVEFLEPCYEGRARVKWTAAQRAEWEALRSRFNAA